MRGLPRGDGLLSASGGLRGGDGARVVGPDVGAVRLLGGGLFAPVFSALSPSFFLPKASNLRFPFSSRLGSEVVSSTGFVSLRRGTLGELPEAVDFCFSTVAIFAVYLLRSGENVDVSTCYCTAQSDASRQ